MTRTTTTTPPPPPPAPPAPPRSPAPGTRGPAQDPARDPVALVVSALLGLHKATGRKPTLSVSVGMLARVAGVGAHQAYAALGELERGGYLTCTKRGADKGSASEFELGERLLGDGTHRGGAGGAEGESEGARGPEGQRARAPEEARAYPAGDGGGTPMAQECSGVGGGARAGGQASLDAPMGWGENRGSLGLEGGFSASAGAVRARGSGGGLGGVCAQRADGQDGHGRTAVDHSDQNTAVRPYGQRAETAEPARALPARSHARRAAARMPLPPRVTRADLRDDAWVMGLFDKLEGDPRCWVRRGDLVWFVACCCHVARKAERSPGGLLLSLLQNPQRGDWLDEECDWDEAKRRVERWQAEPGGGVRGPGPGVRVPGLGGSA